MLGRKKTDKISTRILGLEYLPEGLAFALVKARPGQPRQLIACDYIVCDKAEKPAKLKAKIAELRLENCLCNVLASTNTYSLKFSEAPNVEPGELRAAMYWQVKDIIPMPLEEAVIDVFKLPEAAGRNLAYVVAAEKSYVDEVEATIQGCGLELNAIDIVELSLPNIWLNYGLPSQSMALVWIKNGKASFNVYQDNTLYLSRSFDIDLNSDPAYGSPAETLLLEFQRSLDYYERQLRQAPPAQIYLFGDIASRENIVTLINGVLSIPVDIWPVEQYLPIPEGMDAFSLQRCLGALSVALRNEEVAS